MQQESTSIKQFLYIVSQLYFFDTFGKGKMKPMFAIFESNIHVKRNYVTFPKKNLLSITPVTLRSNLTSVNIRF